MAAVAVILWVLAVQSLAALNLVAAEQSKPNLNACLKMFGSGYGFVNDTPWPYPESWHWEFRMRVDYNASDGSHPQVSILWTDDVGGTFEPSRTSQEVHWRSPPEIICLTINVTVSAPGYESGSDRLAAAHLDIPIPSGGYVQPTPQNCPSAFGVAYPSVNSVSSTTTTIPRLESFCTVALYGYLTVRVTDENGKPIQNALVMINGTLTCNHQTGTVDRSGLTDSDGYVWFDAYPTKYNISVILPETLQSRTILVTQTTFPVGTFQTTLHVACTPSANQCSIAAPKSETQATSVTSAPIPFLDFPGILVAILLGLFVVVKKRERNFHSQYTRRL